MTTTTDTPTDPATLVDLALVARAGERRQQAIDVADLELDAIVREIRRARQAGGRPNLAFIARTTGVSRQTLHARLRADHR